MVRWSRAGRFVYLHAAWTTHETFALPLQAGHAVPSLPAEEIQSPDEVGKLPGVQRRRLQFPQSRSPRSEMNRQPVSSDSIVETCKHDSTWTTLPDAFLTNIWFR